MKRFYLDLETTGTDIQNHGIHQISFIIEYGDVYEEYDFHTNPGNVLIDSWVVDQFISIGSDYTVIGHYEPEQYVFTNIINILNKHINVFDKSDKFQLLAYNSDFDERFFRALFNKYQNNYFNSYFFSPSICIMKLAAYVLQHKRNELINFQLGNVLSIFNIPLDRPHDSLCDIKASRLLLLSLEHNHITINL